jgi:hypothetical protein
MNISKNRSVIILFVPVSLDPFIRPIHTLFYLTDFMLFNHVPVSVDLSVYPLLHSCHWKNRDLEFFIYIPDYPKI